MKILSEAVVVKIWVLFKEWYMIVVVFEVQRLYGSSFWGSAIYFGIIS